MRADRRYRVPAPLPRRIWRLIRTGDPDSYPSRSQALQAVLLSAVNAGHTAQGLWDLLRGREAGIWITHTRDGKPRRNPRAYFDRCWRKAQEYATRNPPFRDRGESFEAVAAVEDAAEESQWRGPGGGTDAALMRYVLAIAGQTGKVRVAVAIRAAAAELIMDPATVSRALGRLRKAGWLRRTRRPTATRAAEYEIAPGASSGTPPQPTYLPDAAATHPHTTRKGGEWVAVASPTFGHEVFSWIGLGRSAERVYERLGPEPVSSAAIAASLGVTPRTARRHLRLLEAHGLAARMLDGWTRGRRDLAEVARELGTAGEQERRRAGYAAHRENRGRWMVERRRRQAGEPSGR